MLSFLVAASASLVLAAAPLPPRPDRHATDRTGRLDAARLARLNERLADFERETSTQVLVYVDARMPPGATLEEVAAAAMAAWGVGQKGKDNGALFLAFLDDRRMRIEVGYGLEGALPDARANRIIAEVVAPAFRQGDFTGGVEAAAGEIVKAARGEPFRGSGRTTAEGRAPAPVLVAPNWVGWIVVALFASIPVLLVVLALRRAWKTAGEADHSPRAGGGTYRRGALGRLLPGRAPRVVGAQGTAPVAAAGPVQAAIVAHGVVAFLEKKGFARFRSLVAHVALLVAASAVPAALRTIGVPSADIPTPLLVIAGSLLVAMFAMADGLGGLRGTSYSWSSKGSGWSSGSSGSSSRSSSSSYSGGGGRSGGGGASGSW